MPVIAEYQPPARAQPRACCADCASPAERRSIRQQGAQIVLGMVGRGRGRPGGLAGIGGPRVDELTGQIKTAQQARAALELANKHLTGAWGMVPQIGLVAAAAGLRQAWRDRIDNVRAYVVRTLGRVPAAGAIDENLRRSAALALVQSLDILKQLDEDISDPELRFWPTFQASLRKIIGGGASFIGGGVLQPLIEGLQPVLIPAAVVGGGFLLWKALRR